MVSRCLSGCMFLRIAVVVFWFRATDASIAAAPVFERFRSVILTSGTLSPLDMYPKMLRFRPGVSKSFNISLARQCICPVVVARGADQVSSFFWGGGTPSGRRVDPGLWLRASCISEVFCDLRPLSVPVHADVSLYVCSYFSGLAVQVALTSKFEKRGDEAVIQNYGGMLRHVAAEFPWVGCP
jgi:hypothetical protein